MRADRVGTKRRARMTAALGAAAIAVVGCAEGLHWRAARRASAPASGPSRNRTEAIVVLGFPARDDGGTHPLQRWRCRIAARSVDPRCDGVVVFSGGAVRNGWPEAEVMARYARDRLGVPPERIRTETKAESTWQNIEFTIPLIEHADRIKIASDPMHAARARRYLAQQRPDLAARLAPAADYRPLEYWWLKIPTAGHELAAIARRRAGQAVVLVLAHTRIVRKAALLGSR
ncbi:YdcF family protein [Nocardia transvalensis]|uniref:YdcF family protein n=1 Tax=Nocardia transvalensis TaxID=37333 RepID=UPI002B4B6B36|nr:YdcF family protein [Nocardia transvalensis]